MDMQPSLLNSIPQGFNATPHRKIICADFLLCRVLDTISKRNMLHNLVNFGLAYSLISSSLSVSSLLFGVSYDR